MAAGKNNKWNSLISMITHNHSTLFDRIHEPSQGWFHGFLLKVICSAFFTMNNGIFYTLA
jgi:hypothetical protein